ncbi:MAG: hypothetical protein OEM82_05540 [Acidobacteriota bacterium]|nr:hypothetical protein [Acidobacteriota bacterium]
MDKDAVNDEYIAAISKALGIEVKPRGFRVRGEKIQVDYPTTSFR